MTHYETVQAGLFLRPCRHPPPGSPPGGHFFLEAYAQVRPRMLLPTWPLRVMVAAGNAAGGVLLTSVEFTPSHVREDVLYLARIGGQTEVQCTPRALRALWEVGSGKSSRL